MVTAAAGGEIAPAAAAYSGPAVGPVPFRPIQSRAFRGAARPVAARGIR